MKKAMAVTTLILFALGALLLILLLFIYFFGPEALLNKAAKGFERIADGILGGIKKEDMKSSQTSTKIEESYLTLTDALRTSQKGPCLIYNPIPTDFEDMHIKLTKNEQGTFIQIEQNKEQIQ